MLLLSKVATYSGTSSAYPPSQPPPPLPHAGGGEKVAEYISDGTDVLDFVFSLNVYNFQQQLNWTSRPFPGDVQVNWRYTFPAGDPPDGLLSTLLFVCRRAVECSYHYHWRHGVLIKTGEVA